MDIKPVSRSTFIFGWLPIGIYSGWIAVATIANISAYLAKLDWDGGFLSESEWTITMIVIATVLYLMMIFLRNMREFAAVGIWALYAIYIRHQDEYVSIAYPALVACGIILIAIVWNTFRTRKSKLVFKAGAESQIQ